MLKRIELLIIVSYMMMVSGLALAQDNEWESLIYVRDEIIRVTANGLDESIVLPQPAQTFNANLTIHNVALSPDEQHFLYIDEPEQNYDAKIYMADLGNDACCTVFPAPNDGTWEVINLLGFSPDGDEIALNFLNAYTGENDSLLAILNITTGEYKTFFDPRETVINTNFVFFLNWTEDGIEIIPSCFPCGASADGPTVLWNPETNEITTDYSFNASAWGDRLANGDIIQSVQDPDYPITTADSMFDPANIVQYFTVNNIDDKELIYFDADNLHLIEPQWVIDGQAYVIQDATAQRITLVWRDGQTEVIEFERQQMFLMGTPNGWLMADIMGQDLIQYHWVDGTIEVTELGTYPTLQPLTQPVLGEDLTEEIMPIIDTNI